MLEYLYSIKMIQIYMQLKHDKQTAQDITVFSHSSLSSSQYIYFHVRVFTFFLLEFFMYIC